MGMSNGRTVSHTATSAVGSQLTARAAASNTNPLAGWTDGHPRHRDQQGGAPDNSCNQLGGFKPGYHKREAGIPGALPHRGQERLFVVPRACITSRGRTRCCARLTTRPASSATTAARISLPPSPMFLPKWWRLKYGHAFSVGNTPHRANEAVLLNQNLHVTCVDCHNPHSTNRVATFPAAPAIRLSQTMVTGISATDGKTVVSPAVNQYENCLRCHGANTGKKLSVNSGYLPLRVVSASDPLNVIPEFSYVCDLKSSGVPRSHQPVPATQPPREHAES